MTNRHPVNPRRQRNAKRPNPPRRTRARKQTAQPRKACKVGRLLTPVLGANRVDTIAAAGGLLPYLARRLVARLRAA